MRNVIAILTALTLAACGSERTPLIVEKPVIQRVEVKTACLTEAEYARIQALAPVPLRSRAIPPDVPTRVAELSAQVIAYEAPGAFVDQAMAALNRCKQP